MKMRHEDGVWPAEKGQEQLFGFPAGRVDGGKGTPGVKMVWIAIITLFCLTVRVCPCRARSAVQTSGDISQIIIPVVAYTTTLMEDDPEGTTQFCKSFLLNLGVTYGLKTTVDKKRPDGGSHAFPSGHTSTSFQGAAFIQRRYGWKFGLPFYLGAAYVGWSRVYSDKHDVTDVLAGAAIGIASSYLFTTPFKNVTVAPLMDDKRIGLTLTLPW